MAYILYLWNPNMLYMVFAYRHMSDSDFSVHIICRKTFFFLHLASAFCKVVARCSCSATLTQVSGISTNESFHMSRPAWLWLACWKVRSLKAAVPCIVIKPFLFSLPDFLKHFLLFHKASQGILVTLCQMIIAEIATSSKAFKSTAVRNSC